MRKTKAEKQQKQIKSEAVVLMRERVPSVWRQTRQSTNPVQGRQRSEQIISSLPHTLSRVPIECDERGGGEGGGRAGCSSELKSLGGSSAEQTKTLQQPAASTIQRPAASAHQDLVP